MWSNIVGAVIGGLLALAAAEAVVALGRVLPWNEAAYAACVVGALALTYAVVKRG